MATNTAVSGFRIWGMDNVVYGPFDLPVLLSWVKEERVGPQTWIYSHLTDAWQKASNLPELRNHLHGSAAATVPPTSPPLKPAVEAGEVSPELLRRVKILSALSDDQLKRFLNFVEVVVVKAGQEIVKQGQPGEALYMVLEGETRVRMIIAGKESVMVNLLPGDFFGEVSLFDHGPRSADVVANKDSQLLKLSSRSFQALMDQAPDLATPFLFSLSQTLMRRIRADNKRYRDSVNWARTLGKS